MSFSRRTSGRCEKRSDEESLIQLKFLQLAKNETLRSAQRDMNIICIQSLELFFILDKIRKSAGIDLKDMDSFFAQLTPKIQADLPGWYGSEAKLADEPTFHPRNWSFIFRYVVQVSELDSKAILVKVR